MLGQRLNKSDYYEIMLAEVRCGQYSVEAAKLILEEAGVEITGIKERQLLWAETEFLNEIATMPALS